MTQIIAFRQDGSQFSTVANDPNLVSKLEPGQATETWQAGYVRGHLAVSRKTVSAVSDFLSALEPGTEIEVSYRCPLRRTSVLETFRLDYLPGHAQPALLSLQPPALLDEDITRELGIYWGEYITVTYRALKPRAAMPIGGLPDLARRIERLIPGRRPGDLVPA